MVFEWLGATLVLVGIFLFAIELIHPGALLLIPGSILLVAGMLALFFSDSILTSVVGVLAIVGAAVISAIVEIPYYRYIAPVHRPMTTTSAGLTGEVGVLVADVIPNTLKGKVRVKSEIWSAQADVPIPTGAKVRIVSGEGVAVRVVQITDSGPGN
jgi:membrane-bound ClpP family serine protease